MHVRGYPWISMDVHAKPWISIDIHTFQCISLHVHGYSWILDSGPWQRGGLRSLPPRRQPIWELWTLTLHNSGVCRTASNHHPMPTGAPGRRTLLAGPSFHDRQFGKEVFALGHIYTPDLPADPILEHKTNSGDNHKGRQPHPCQSRKRPVRVP